MASAVVVWCCAGLVPAYPLKADTSAVMKLAVFDFELQDESASLRREEARA